MSRMRAPNFSIFSGPSPWTVLSCARFCGWARTMLRRVVEASTKKRGRLSFSDSALRHSRRRWSRACCSGVRVSVGSAAAWRALVWDSAEAVLVLWWDQSCAVLARFGGLSDSLHFGRDDDSFLPGARLTVTSERQMGVISAP